MSGAVHTSGKWVGGDFCFVSPVFVVNVKNIIYPIKADMPIVVLKFSSGGADLS